MQRESTRDVSGDPSAALPSWCAPGDSAGFFEGEPYGSPISSFIVDAKPGEGPALHFHPYTETFVILAGSGRFDVGDRQIDAVAGNLLVVPSRVPHAFRALGPEHLRLIAIHAAPRVETTWLTVSTQPDEPEAPICRP
jgi:mannose-6-phosphate isomerase-like protein (cupin superfamily)